MGHVLAYSTPGQLFRAEMRVLFWMAAALAGVSAVLFVRVGFAFHGPDRPPSWLVGSYLLDWVLLWAVYLSTWYYWAEDRPIWRHAVAGWHYGDFRLAGILLAASTLTGVVLQHSPRATIRPVGVWAFYVAAGAGAFVLWGVGNWPFR